MPILAQCSTCHVLIFCGGVQCSGEGHLRSHGDEALGHALHPGCSPHCPEGRAWPCTLVVEDSVDMAGYGGNGHHTNICLIDWYGWFELVGLFAIFQALIWKKSHVIAGSCRQIEAYVNGTHF